MPKTEEVISLMLQNKLADVELLFLRILKRNGLPLTLNAHEASLLVSSKNYKGKKLSREVLIAILTCILLPMMRKHITSGKIDPVILGVLNIGADLVTANNKIMNAKLEKIKKLPSKRTQKSWAKDNKRRKNVESRHQEVIAEAKKLLKKNPILSMHQRCGILLTKNAGGYNSDKQIRQILRDAGLYH